MKRSAVLAPILVAAGCASMWAGRVRPSVARFPPERAAEVWSAAFEELGVMGFAIEVADGQRGVLRTAKQVRPGRTLCGFVTCRYRDTVEVVVTPDGSASVRITRELAGGSIWGGGGWIFAGERWDPPYRGQKAALEAIAAEQDELLRAITE